MPWKDGRWDLEFKKRYCPCSTLRADAPYLCTGSKDMDPQMSAERRKDKEWHFAEDCKCRKSSFANIAKRCTRVTIRPKGYLLMLLMLVVLVLLLRRQKTKLKRVWEGKVSHGRKRNDCARHVGCQNIPEKVVHIEFLSPRCTRTLLHALKGGASAAGAGLQLPRAIVHGLWRVYGM